MSYLDNSNIIKHLGQTSKYKSKYDPSLLVREARSNNRQHLNITEDNLPFVGYDLWNAYEISCLNANGVPVTGLAKIIYPCDSTYIVESKSLKLYLNSLNMTYFDNVEREEIYNSIEKLVAEDLSFLLETSVICKIFPSTTNTGYTDIVDDIHDFITLEYMECNKNVSCNIYSENSTLLRSSQYNKQAVTEQKYHSSLLKSNCRVTSQPDWGDVYITYKGSHSLDPAALLKYIISFRDECHFHEEICETIYKRLYDAFNPIELTVMCLYVRRGGIDINPIRSNNIKGIYRIFTDPKIIFKKTARQ